MGHAVFEFMELFKEGACKINLFAIRKSIPLIAEPDILRVDREGLFVVIHGDDLLPGKITFAVVERAGVSNL